MNRNVEQALTSSTGSAAAPRRSCSRARVVLERWRGDLAAARLIAEDTVEGAGQLGTDVPLAVALSTRATAGWDVCWALLGLSALAEIRADTPSDLPTGTAAGSRPAGVSAQAAGRR